MVTDIFQSTGLIVELNKTRMLVNGRDINRETKSVDNEWNLSFHALSDCLLNATVQCATNIHSTQGTF